MTDNGNDLDHLKVRTVLGDVPASSLGHTQPHEHVLADVSVYFKSSEDAPLSERALEHQPITLDNYQAVRRNPYAYRDNLSRFDVDEATEMVALYGQWGGGSVVDSTSIGLGRDPKALARISRATGVQIIMGGGAYIQPAHPGWVTAASEDELTEAFVRDIEVGVNGTDIRCGLLGEIGLSSPPHPDEERVLRAAVRAQLRTGVAVQIHIDDRESAMRGLEVVDETGGDLSRVILAHIDGSSQRAEQLTELASSGAWLELDFFGFEQPLIWPGPIVEQTSDSQRIGLLLELVRAGYRDRLLISQDIAMKMQTTRYGGEGLQHILENVIPLALALGLSEADMAQICRVNPATVLAMR